TFDMIGGHDDHVKMIHEMIKISLLYPEAAKQAESIKGLLFYGPPGNGKTLMARAIASTYSTATNPVSFFPIHASEIHSKWFGDSEKHLRKLFQDAKAAQPSIIFFDEIDGVVPSRASGESSAPHNSVVTALLTLMDGLESRGRVIVIGATNRLDTLDPALLRPGRFDRQLRFNPPNRIARRKIIDIKTHEYGLDDSIKDEMALVTEGFSGADLKALCADAWYKALR
ncbi:P-loop containing nucleoside triphosphate hydrolase protein, partial [Gaertneriomyces semiglobifer]